MTPQTWHFDYAPIHTYGRAKGEPERDLVLATRQDVDPTELVQALAGLTRGVAVTPLLSMHPLFWTRLELSEPVSSSKVTRSLLQAGVSVRYVTSARHGSQRLGSPLDFTSARPRRARAWPTRTARAALTADETWQWFRGELGVNVTRSVCGSGAGTRLAIIDNDGRDTDKVELDEEILVGVDSIPRAGSHCALMLGWAIGARLEAPRASDPHWTPEARFVGVAPDASARFYCIPKPRDSVFDLPLALVRAVDDGADVVVCATYVDGQTSPLLDDALEFAARLGRGGRGTAVVLPSSREMSSAPGKVGASLSLGIAEPASDPRTFCIGPSSRDGSWFLWRDRRGKLRPFANRGPALRWLAPGDDMASPVATGRRNMHAESSGASAIAAGVLLLVLGQAPTLTVDELGELVTRSAEVVDPARQSSLSDLADRSDLLPTGTDADGHNAKHGYGRMDATGACLLTRDPFVAALASIGESELAAQLHAAFQDGRLKRPYSEELANFSARALFHDPTFRHALSVLARSVRFHVAEAQESSTSAPNGAYLRQALVTLRLLARTKALTLPTALLRELDDLDFRLLRWLEASDDTEIRFIDSLRSLTSAPKRAGGSKSPTSRAALPAASA